MNTDFLSVTSLFVDTREAGGSGRWFVIEILRSSGFQIKITEVIDTS